MSLAIYNYSCKNIRIYKTLDELELKVNNKYMFNEDNIKCISSMSQKYYELTNDNKDEQIPETVTHIVLDGEYKYPLPKLPSNLLYLDLGESSIKHKLPKLPESLLYLDLGFGYNRKIIKLPPNLLFLKLGALYKKEIPELPSSLTHFIDYNGYNSYITLEKLPSSLKSLNIIIDSEYFNLHLLPPDLTHLTLDVLTEINYNYLLDELPQSLLYFNIDNYNMPLTNLPNTLLVLIIGQKYNYSLDLLPDSIEILDIQYYNNKINKLPANIKKIIINKKYNYVKELLSLKPDVEIYISGDFYSYDDIMFNLYRQIKL